MKTDMEIFLRTPEDSALHPGKVSSIADKGCNAVFEADAFRLEEGAEILVYYELSRRFMQQPARVVSVAQAEENRISLELETTGDPVSAENRECYRVSCYAADISAKLGGDSETCEVLDLSATGFAVFSKAEYQVGQSLEATLYHDGNPATGTVVVQSASEYGKQMRYGLRALDDERPDATLKQALNRVNLAIQREQVARLSGNL
jgi:hypothetical protein